MSDAMKLLRNALEDQAAAARKIVGKIADDEVAMNGLSYTDLSPLRNSADITRYLAQQIESLSPDQIHAIFGAPGDWGYETRLGDALARVYGVIK